MLVVKVIIKSLDIDMELFTIDVQKDLLKEVFDAIICERQYNGSELDFGGLKYKDEVIK